MKRRTGRNSSSLRFPQLDLSRFHFSEFHSRRSSLSRHIFPHYFLFPVVLVYFEFLLLLFSGKGVLSHFIYPLLFGIGIGMLLSCITSAFSRKVNRRITIGLLFGIALIFIIECLVRSSFQFYMPFLAIFTGAGDVAANYAGNLFSAVMHGIPVILMYFLPGILYTIFGKAYLPARRFKPRGLCKLFAYFVIILTAGTFLASHGSSRTQYKTEYKFDTATRYFGLLTSVRLDMKYALLGNKALSSFTMEAEASAHKEETAELEEPRDYGKNEMDLPLEEVAAASSDENVKSLSEYISTLTPSSKNKYTGLFKGKNLILICAEALSDAAVNQELMPTLYRLVHNGFYFSDFYQPSWGGSTSTGEYSFLTGLVPLHEENTILMSRDKDMYFTMGNQLKRLGYFSRAYHNGEYDFYSRNTTHENLGYEKFLALGNGLEELFVDWPTDAQTFDKTMDMYIKQEPFSIYYMTIDGHCVYVADDKKTRKHINQVRAAVGDQYEDTTLYYLCYQMELEEALKVMVEKLEEAGIADDTVICMTGDHYPYGLEESSTFGTDADYVADLYGYDPSNSWEQDHNALVIWSGCLENEQKNMACEISTPVSSLDILPTLLNLFGLEFDSRLLAGRDVFSDADPLVLWNNYSWVTDKGKYDSATDVYTANDGSQGNDAYVQKIKSVVANKLSLSEQILETDYYRLLRESMAVVNARKADEAADGTGTPEGGSGDQEDGSGGQKDGTEEET